MQTSTPPQDDIAIALCNFRDFGGQAAGSGRRVKRGYLFRSSDPALIPTDARARLLDLGLEAIVDLRHLSERERYDNPWSGPAQVHILAHDDRQPARAPHVEVLLSNELGTATLQELYRDVYDDILFGPAYGPLFGSVFRFLGSRPPTRILLHCAAGKDRTGLLAAMLLSMLGVDDEDVLADYLASNDADFSTIEQAVQRDMQAAFGRTPSLDVVRGLLRLERNYAIDAFARVAERHGSMRGYLRSLGVSDQELDRLVENYTMVEKG